MKVLCKKNFVPKLSTSKLNTYNGIYYHCITVVQDRYVAIGDGKNSDVFCLQKESKWGVPSFSEYFYTEQEIRKMKIKRLNIDENR